MDEQDRRLAAARVLVELTERALVDGLEAAVDAALSQLRTLHGTEIHVDLGNLGGQAVVSDGSGLDGVTDVLVAAIASAQRALVARSTEDAGVDALRTWARIDDLTGALNRRALLEHLDAAIARSQPVTLVLCDVDGLKAINDVHGHPTGDAALRAFVDLVTANLRSSDAIGRIGGDEFALVLPGAGTDAVARILGRLAATIEGGPSGVAEVRASFGTAWFPDDGSSRDELIATADRRLYDDKRRSRARQT